MDRYMLGLMSLEERATFEARLALDEMAREQFARFREMWEGDRFDSRRHGVALPPESRERSRWGQAFGFWRMGMGLATLGLLLWTGSSWFGGSFQTGHRVLPYADGGFTTKRDGEKPLGVPSLRKARKRPLLAMRIKGASAPGAKQTSKPSLVIALWRGETIVQARSGQRFVAGDRLRLAYRWYRGGYVFLAHQEGAKVEPLYPRSEQVSSLQIQEDGVVLLPGSLEVSGSGMRDEWLLACFSKHPISWGDLKQGLVSLTKKTEGHSLRECEHVLRFLIRRE